MPNWAEIVAALAGAGAVVVAGLAWRAAISTLRTSYRPVVRPVVMRHPNGDIDSVRLLLKNFGRGPAVSVFLVEPEPPRGERWPPTHPGPVVAHVDVVEPLGPAMEGGGEATRIGRVVMVIPDLRLLRRTTTYRLLYQDVAARWHETTFTIDGESRLSVRYKGALGWFDTDGLPSAVKEQAQIVQQVE